MRLPLASTKRPLLQVAAFSTYQLTARSATPCADATNNLDAFLLGRLTGSGAGEEGCATGPPRIPCQGGNGAAQPWLRGSTTAAGRRALDRAGLGRLRGPPGPTRACNSVIDPQSARRWSWCEMGSGCGGPLIEQPAAACAFRPGRPQKRRRRCDPSNVPPLGFIPSSSRAKSKAEATTEASASLPCQRDLGQQASGER